VAKPVFKRWKNWIDRRLANEGAFIENQNQQSFIIAGFFPINLFGGIRLKALEGV